RTNTLLWSDRRVTLWIHAAVRRRLVAARRGGPAGGGHAGGPRGEGGAARRRAAVASRGAPGAGPPGAARAAVGGTLVDSGVNPQGYASIAPQERVRTVSGWRRVCRLRADANLRER